MATTTNYIWDDENYLAESDGTNTINVVYTNEPEQYGNLVSTRISTTTSYHHFDALGSTRQLTNVVGTVTDRMIYDAWGNVVNRTGSTGINLLWIGEMGYYCDPEVGLFYVRARLYGPAVGRWTAVDRLLFSHFSNLYNYGANCPTFIVDPSGLIPDLSIASDGRICQPCGLVDLDWNITAPDNDPDHDFPLLIVQQLCILGVAPQCAVPPCDVKCNQTVKALAAKCCFFEFLGVLGAEAALGKPVDPKNMKPVTDTWTTTPFATSPECSSFGDVSIWATIRAFRDPELKMYLQIRDQQDKWTKSQAGLGLVCGSSDNPNVTNISVGAGPFYRLAAPSWWGGIKTLPLKASGSTALYLGWECCPGHDQFATTFASGEGEQTFGTCWPYEYFPGIF